MYKAMRAPSMYAQSPDCLNDFYDICKGYGKRFLFICSHSGLAAAEPKITKSCDEIGRASCRERVSFCV